jgi:4-amino-4-deoxy-L-arabinose transferase-like glycosyltransferase
LATLAVLCALGLLAAASIWVATPWGVGVEYDSVFYWSAAENLLAGRGLGRLDGGGDLIPLTHFPPLYPLTLAALSGASGTSVAEAARLISAALFGLNVFLLGRAVLALVHSKWLALGAALTGLLAPTLLERHLWALSEPLYFTWLLGSLFCLVRSIDEPGRRWLLAAAVTAGLAALTRYAGLPVLATGLIVSLAAGARPRRGRLDRALIYTLTAAALPAAWQIRNLVLAGTTTNRVLLFHPLQGAQLREAGSTLARWLPFGFVPAELRLAALALLGLAALVLVAGAARRGGAPEVGSAWWLAIVAGLHGVVYAAFLIVSLTLFDASTRLRDRILSPVFLSGILLAVGLLAMSRVTRSKAMSLAGALALSLLLIPYAAGSWLRLDESRRNGLGFVSASWRTSKTIALVRELPADLELYSNEAFPIYYLTGRPAFWVPERTDPVKGIERADYHQQLEAMRSDLEGGGAALVLFHPQVLPPELPSLDELTGGLAILDAAADGTIYYATEP